MNDIYEIILNGNFKELKVKDLQGIKVVCKVVNAVSMNGNVKRYFYKVLIGNDIFKYDLEKHYNIFELLQVVKNDMELDLPF